MPIKTDLLNLIIALHWWYLMRDTTLYIHTSFWKIKIEKRYSPIFSEHIKRQISKSNSITKHSKCLSATSKYFYEIILWKINFYILCFLDSAVTTAAVSLLIYYKGKWDCLFSPFCSTNLFISVSLVSNNKCKDVQIFSSSHSLLQNFKYYITLHLIPDQKQMFTMVKTYFD